MNVFQRVAGWVTGMGNKATLTKLINLLNSGYSLGMINRTLVNIPEVRTAIYYIARVCGTVPFNHVINDPETGVRTRKWDRMDSVFRVRTNPYQCPSIFIESMVAQLLIWNNAFALPIWDDGAQLKWIMPLPFRSFQFKNINGELYIEFPGADQSLYKYCEIIHLQRFPTFRGGMQDQATGNYTDIVSTMQAQAVNDAKTSGRLGALMIAKTGLNPTHMKKKLEEFKELFMSSENTTGFGMVGSEYDVKELNFKINPLNFTLLEGVTKAIYNYFGVSPEIINGTANDVQNEHFIKGTVKPIVEQIEQVSTYTLFTDSAIAQGHMIVSDLFELHVATLAAKTVLADKGVYGGWLNKNGARRLFSMSPIPGGEVYTSNKNAQTLDELNAPAKGGKKPNDPNGKEDGQTDQNPE